MLTTAHKLLWLIPGGGGLVALDQIIKILVWTSSFTLRGSGRYWWMTWHQNYGISFGVVLPYTLSVTLIAAFLLLLLWLLFQRSTRHPLMVAGLILSIAGGASNLIDRVSLGFVRDFIALVPWLPIFNLADILIVVGVILILWRFYWRERT